jgi:uncharacterized phage infection (PIP) family protein YhgE
MNFRSAFNGFNREDVVHFIEYLNAKHTAEINQLNSELELLRSRSGAPLPAPAAEPVSDAASEEVEQLKAQLAELQKRYDALASEKAPTVQYSTAQELEAYRRAERTERIAKERAEQVYHQVNGALADATVKVDGTFAQLGELADQLTDQLAQLQELVNGSRQALSDASATLYTIRPTGDEL